MLECITKTLTEATMRGIFVGINNANCNAKWGLLLGIYDFVGINTPAAVSKNRFLPGILVRIDGDIGFACRDHGLALSLQIVPLSHRLSKMKSDTILAILNRLIISRARRKYFSNATKHL